MNNSQMLKALVQNYGFRQAKPEKLPTIDFVYPSYTADGNTESFRFSSTLRRELRERAQIVREALEGKTLAWTNNEETIKEIDPIATRLGIDELVSGRINSIYSGYSPILFVGASPNEFTSYLIKPVVDASMAWFEFTPQEQNKVNALLVKKATEKPYRTFVQILLGGKLR